MTNSEWGKLDPMGKLLAFKRLNAAEALEFYRALPFEDKYFLFCGFPLESIAPLLETLPEAERGRLQMWPKDFQRRMRGLLDAGLRGRA